MPVQTIIKRDGTFVPFQKERIFNALQQAFLATQSPHSKETLLRLTDQVTDAVNRRYHARTIPAVEEIQDIIEQTLMEEHFGDVAKAYILYRHQHERLREGKALVLDIEKTMDGYLSLGMVNQHKDLLIGDDQCIGGGYYQFDWTSNRMLLDRASYDFGRPRWHLLETLKVPASYRGLRIVYLYDDDHEDFIVSDELPIEYYE